MLALNWLGDSLDGTLARVRVVGLAAAFVVSAVQSAVRLYRAEPVNALSGPVRESG